MTKTQVSIRHVIQLPQDSIGFCLGVFVCEITTDARLLHKEAQNERQNENRQEERY